jgi:hypothetical protein
MSVLTAIPFTRNEALTGLLLALKPMLSQGVSSPYGVIAEREDSL